MGYTVEKVFKHTCDTCGTEHFSTDTEDMPNDWIMLYRFSCGGGGLPDGKPVELLNKYYCNCECLLEAIDQEV